MTKNEPPLPGGLAAEEPSINLTWSENCISCGVAVRIYLLNYSMFSPEESCCFSYLFVYLFKMEVTPFLSKNGFSCPLEKPVSTFIRFWARMILGTQEWKARVGWEFDVRTCSESETCFAWWLSRPSERLLLLWVWQFLPFRCCLTGVFHLVMYEVSLLGLFKDVSWVADWIVIMHAKGFPPNLLKCPKPDVEIFYCFPGVQRVPDHQDRGDYISHGSQHSGCPANVQARHWLLIKEKIESHLFI